MEYVTETKNLTKRFPNKLALDHVDIHVKKGDIYGFIGKNGAGKTTAMKLILGLIHPTEGSVTLFFIRAEFQSAVSEPAGPECFFVRITPAICGTLKTEANNKR